MSIVTDTKVASIRARLFQESESFRKKTGRHVMTTPGMAYCAFSTPKLTITREEGRRNAAIRLEGFGLTPEVLHGKTILDLGCNAGAMLLEASNHGIRRGLGLEFDREKILLAREIAALSDLRMLEFEAADIDTLDAQAIGSFDIVLALAIEGHVNDPDRLYRVLGQVTGQTLCFEGNSKCDTAATEVQLRAAGFSQISHLGFCTDDLSARFNNRPMIVARRG